MKLIFVTCCLLLLTFSLCAQTARADTTEQAREILANALKDTNPEKRKQCVIALSLGGSEPFILAQLETALHDADVEVRIAACAALASVAGKRSQTLLEQTLQDEVPEVSFAAAKALYELGNPLGPEIMLDVLAGERKTGSGFIASQKRDMLRLMKNRDALLRLGIQQGIGYIPVPGLDFALTSVEGLLKDAGTSGRAFAAMMLAREKDNASLQALRAALSDKDWSVRAAAIHAITVRKRGELRAEFVPLFEDKKEAVRLRAAAAYLRLAGIYAGQTKTTKVLKNHRK